MIADKKYIEHLRTNSHFKIDEKLEAYILAEYEEEPFPYMWSEQDLYEQIRKLVMKYNTGELDDTVKPEIERLCEYYEDVQEEYMDLVFEVQALKQLLKEYGKFYLLALFLGSSCCAHNIVLPHLSSICCHYMDQRIFFLSLQILHPHADVKLCSKLDR